MPIYMNYGGIDGDISMTAATVRQLPGDGSVRPYPGASALADKMRKMPSSQVGGILIGLMSVPGYRAVRNEKGIIAVLIGLLLPAVQKLATSNAADLQSLKSALAPTGAVGIAMCDGSVRTLVGPASFFRFEGLPGECDWVGGRSRLESVAL